MPLPVLPGVKVHGLIGFDPRQWPWRPASNAERRAAWNAAYNDIPAEHYIIKDPEPNTVKWRWFRDFLPEKNRDD